MNIVGEVIANKANGTRAPGNTEAAKRAARDRELDTHVETVAATLERLGHCPVTELVNAVRQGKLNDQQAAAVNRWLMEQKYKGEIKVSGKLEHTHRAVSSVDEFIEGFGLGIADGDPPALSQN